MDWIWNILALIFVFVAIGFCIFSHELGHFLAAKWRGLHIDAFSLGFKPFWRKKINGVEYRLGWLPFGGYVELPQVDATDAIPKAADGTELPRAKPLDRIITAVAGPLFNILSGLLLGCVIWWVGLPQDTPKMRELTVLTVDQSGPEWKAGLRPGDKIVRINGKPFFGTWRELILNKILLTVGEVEFDVHRDRQTVKMSYVPAENPNAPPQLRAEKIAWPFFTVLIPVELDPKAGSPAEKAGIKKGDFLVALDGETISDFGDFQSMIDIIGSEGENARLTVRRGKEMLEFSVRPEPQPKLGDKYNFYRIGAGLQTLPDTPGVVIASTVSGAPAEKAGLAVGERVLKLDGKPVTSSADFIDRLQLIKSNPMKLELARNGKTETVEITPQLITPHTIGAEMELRDHPTPVQQFVNTFEMSRKSLVGILVGVGNKLGLTDQTSSLKPSHMSGPLGMGMIIFSSTRQALLQNTSFTTVLHFIVIISFALAIFNLFPLPVLDGGHILFGLIEIVFGRPLPTIVIKGLSTVFVVLLIGLMIFVTLSDGNRLARSSGISDKFSGWFSDNGKSPEPPVSAEAANGDNKAK